MSSHLSLNNMVANSHNRLATLDKATFGQSLIAIPKWEPDLNDPKPVLANGYIKFVKKPFLNALFGSGGNREYLTLGLVRGRNQFCNDVNNIVTKAQMTMLIGELDDANIVLKASTNAM